MIDVAYEPNIRDLWEALSQPRPLVHFDSSDSSYLFNLLQALKKKNKDALGQLIFIEDGVSYVDLNGDPKHSFGHMTYGRESSSVKERVLRELEELDPLDDRPALRVLWLSIKKEELADLEVLMRGLLWRIAHLNQKTKILIQTEAIPQELTPWAYTLTLSALNDDPSSIGFVGELLKGSLNDHNASTYSTGARVVKEVYQLLRGVDIPSCVRSVHAALAIVLKEARPQSWQSELIKELSRSKTSILNQINGLEQISVDSFEVSSLSGMSRYIRYLDYVKCVYDNDDEAKRQKIDSPKGVLFVGLPGCGKSMAAKATAKVLDVPLIRLDLSQLMGRYLGQSEERLDKALRTVESISPCVLFIDEIEKSIGSLGGQGEGGTGLRMLSQLLTWMQELDKDVYLFATANKIATLPPELLRRGRFDELWCVKLPSDAERLALINASLRSKNIKLSDHEARELSMITKDFSGADLIALIKRSQIYSFTQDREKGPSISDFKEVLKNFIPMTTQFKSQLTEMIDQLDEYGFTDVSSEELPPQVKRKPPIDQELMTHFFSPERWLIDLCREGQHLFIQSDSSESCLLTDQPGSDLLTTNMSHVITCQLSYKDGQGYVELRCRDSKLRQRLGLSSVMTLSEDGGLFTLTTKEGVCFVEVSRKRPSILKGHLRHKRKKKW